MIYLFVIDTSASMNQRSASGFSFLGPSLFSPLSAPSKLISS